MALTREPTQTALPIDICLPTLSGSLCFFLFQSEPEGFSHFHLYVCAAFLVRWRREILEERDFQVSNHFFRRAPVRFCAERKVTEF